jgi:hypothetical protein
MAQQKLGRKDFSIAVKHGADSGAVKFKKEATKGELFFDTAQNKLYIALTSAGVLEATVVSVTLS